MHNITIIPSVISFCFFFCVFKIITNTFLSIIIFLFLLCSIFSVLKGLKGPQGRIEVFCVIKFKAIINYFFKKCSVVVSSFFLIPILYARETVEKFENRPVQTVRTT